MLISVKIGFKTKTVRRDKEGHYIMIKRSIQEDIIIVNIYEPPKYIKQILTHMKVEIDSNTIIVGVLKHPTYISEQFIQTENHYRNTGLKWHIRQDRQ